MAAVLSLALEGDVLAAQRGDAGAFARLIDATRNVVCAITLAIVRDVPSSEDVAQEVFVAAWGSVTKLRNPASFLPWLRQLARNQAHAFIRARSRFGRRHAPWSDEAVAAVADPSADTAGVLIDAEDRRALAEAIDELPDEAREIVTLYYREGNSTKQVAELLGLSEDAVKKRLERAREALKKSLLERAAETLRKSAPGAGFTAAVVAAITLATPATAGAATAGLAKAASVTGVLGKAGAAASGILLGAGSAFFAIGWGGRRMARLARDDRERADIWRLIGVNLAAVILTSLATWLWNDARDLFHVANWSLFALVILLSYGVWLPRITSRRLALERLEDPAAEARQKKERIRRTIGALVGFGFGAAGLIYGLMHR